MTDSVKQEFTKRDRESGHSTLDQASPNTWERNFLPQTPILTSAEYRKGLLAREGQITKTSEATLCIPIPALAELYLTLAASTWLTPIANWQANANTGLTLRLRYLADPLRYLAVR
ncbi:hypothetical protein Pla22_40060 [Rubripirellula amarantea]|uniref:Uncharacterized protein n=1 Tax=Rubripirellula amarantea TaxID=2527999 RepID=A0A5C5WMB1_9BACT|nr:hypothetical protein Pla22_40060 [Rubripirellula amarantea]